MNATRSIIISSLLIISAYAGSIWLYSSTLSAQAPAGEPVTCEDVAATIAELTALRARVEAANTPAEIQAVMDEFNRLETHDHMDLNVASQSGLLEDRRAYLIERIDETIEEDASQGGENAEKLRELRTRAESAEDFAELNLVAGEVDEVRGKLGMSGGGGGGGGIVGGGGGGAWAGGVLDGSGKNNRAPVPAFTRTVVLGPGDDIQGAINSATPGTDIQLKSGTYVVSNLSISGKGGNPNAWIRLGNAPGEHPIIRQTGGYGLVNVGGGSSYILIEGLELSGDRVGTTLPDGTYIGSWEDMLAYSNRSCSNIGYHCNQGINLGSGGSTSNQAHHIVVRDNVTHDFGGSGITQFGVDYIIIEDNVTFNNGNFSRYGESGISVGFNAMTGGGSLSDYGVIVRRNIAYNNKQYLGSIDCGCGPGITDGNGIIVDGADYNGAYRRILLESNLSYNNGIAIEGQGVHGSGMHAVDSSNVEFINNTAYNNAAAQIFSCCDSNNVKFSNNIAVGPRPLFHAHGGTATGECNISSGSENIPTTVADPMFVNPTAGDFSLRAGSPAINSACGQTASSDLNGRTAIGAKDIGAIESN